MLPISQGTSADTLGLPQHGHSVFWSSAGTTSVVVQKRVWSAWGHYNEIVDRVRAKWGCKSKAKSPDLGTSRKHAREYISGWDCWNAGHLVLVEIEAITSGQQFSCLEGTDTAQWRHQAPAFSHSSCGCGTTHQAIRSGRIWQHCKSQLSVNLLLQHGGKEGIPR